MNARTEASAAERFLVSKKDGGCVLPLTYNSFTISFALVQTLFFFFLLTDKTRKLQKRFFFANFSAGYFFHAL